MAWRRAKVLTSLFGLVLLLSLTGIGMTSRSAAGTISLVDLTPTNGSNSSTSVNLAELVAGDVPGFIVGDKIFTGFSYSTIGLDMPSAETVEVLGFRDPAGNWGLSLHGTFSDFPGNGPSDAFVRFMVQIDANGLQQGLRINDAHLFLSGVGLQENSFFSVDESFLETNQTMSVFKSSINGNSQHLSDWVDLDPRLPKLTVTKDIYAFANDNATGPARATLIDQSFSQDVIPEPATIVLSLVGMLALTGFVRRRDARQRR
jgi:hypothetical protein